MTNTVKEYAFLSNENIVKNIVVFAFDFNDEDANIFAINTGYTKAISCLTYGKPYIGDTWDNVNNSWIETAPRTTLEIPIEETPAE